MPHDPSQIPIAESTVPIPIMGMDGVVLLAIAPSRGMSSYPFLTPFIGQWVRDLTPLLVGATCRPARPRCRCGRAVRRCRAWHGVAKFKRQSVSVLQGGAKGKMLQNRLRPAPGSVHDLGVDLGVDS